jgi:hypothetical protein
MTDNVMDYYTENDYLPPASPQLLAVQPKLVLDEIPAWDEDVESDPDEEIDFVSFSTSFLLSQSQTLDKLLTQANSVELAVEPGRSKRRAEKKTLQSGRQHRAQRLQEE